MSEWMRETRRIEVRRQAAAVLAARPPTALELRAADLFKSGRSMDECALDLNLPASEVNAMIRARLMRRDDLA